MDCDKRVLTPDEVAAETGLCRKTVYNELKSGKLCHVRAGDRYLISRRNLEKWLEGNQVKVCA